mgnify:CR=1 FL=1
MKKAITQLLKIVQKSSADQSPTAAESVANGTQRRYAARSPTQLMGERGELIAREYLEQAGLRYVDGNVASPFGEIDLIMRDGAVTVFVEVRYRRSASYGDAASSVTPQKQQRLLKAARLWLCRQNGSFETVDCRFDVVAFTGNDIQWLKNAFGE